MFHLRTPNTKYQSNAFKFPNFWRSTIPLPRKPYALVSVITKKNLRVSDGSSEGASE